MLAQIPDLKRKIATALLLATTATFVSCASQKEDVAMVKDPDAKRESMIPWNKQERWETAGGNLSGITDKR
jgi:Spy/CpxP family protein refolding chaperone